MLPPLSLKPFPITFHRQHKSNIKVRRWVKFWLRDLVKNNLNFKSISFILCSDNYLLTLNKKYLSHNTLTDIITFNNSWDEKVIEGEAYISTDRLVENAHKFNVNPEEELHRLLVHAVLHLIGYNDNSESGKKQMRKLENEALCERTKFRDVPRGT